MTSGVKTYFYKTSDITVPDAVAVDGYISLLEQNGFVWQSSYTSDTGYLWRCLPITQTWADRSISAWTAWTASSAASWQFTDFQTSRSFCSISYFLRFKHRHAALSGCLCFTLFTAYLWLLLFQFRQVVDLENEVFMLHSAVKRFFILSENGCKSEYTGEWHIRLLFTFVMNTQLIAREDRSYSVPAGCPPPTPGLRRRARRPGRPRRRFAPPSARSAYRIRCRRCRRRRTRKTHLAVFDEPDEVPRLISVVAARETADRHDADAVVKYDPAGRAGVLYGDQKARAVVVFEHVLDQSVGQAAPTSRLRIRTGRVGIHDGEAPSVPVS